jgi:nitrous oxidase accessory protein NosD
VENFIVSLRKIAAALVLTACSSATHNSGDSGQLTGASAPRVAVEQFLSAVNAKDLQAMSTIWGTQNGPARETMDRNDMEKREVILACYFAHDSARILGETAGVKGHRDVRVELKKGNLTRQTTFFTIKGPGDRWYVDNMDLASVRDFCGNPGA